MNSLFHRGRTPSVNVSLLLHRKDEETRLDAYEMKGLRKILRVSWTAKKTNLSGFLTKLE